MKIISKILTIGWRSQKEQHRHLLEIIFYRATKNLVLALSYTRVLKIQITIQEIVANQKRSLRPPPILIPKILLKHQTRIQGHSQISGISKLKELNLQNNKKIGKIFSKQELNQHLGSAA